MGGPRGRGRNVRRLSLAMKKRNLPLDLKILGKRKKIQVKIERSGRNGCRAGDSTEGGRKKSGRETPFLNVQCINSDQNQSRVLFGRVPPWGLQI